MSTVVAAVVLLILHGLDGHEIRINPTQVTSLHSAIPDKSKKMLTDEVGCVVGLTDGKFASVIETCEVVEEMLEAAR
jgi:hypothetical protein